MTVVNHVSGLVISKGSATTRKRKSPFADYWTAIADSRASLDLLGSTGHPVDFVVDSLEDRKLLSAVTVHAGMGGDVEGIAA